MDKDPYTVLGVSPSATKDEINRAFRALASKYHPDRNPEDTEAASVKFKEAASAFEVLGDDARRRQYDLYREGGFSTFSFKNRNPVDDIFNNMFSHFFGDQRPDGSKIRIKISLEEAYFGCSKKVSAERRECCSGCNGTGSSSWETCTKCSGKGFFSFSQAGFQTKSSCVVCGGRGSVARENCSSCSGLGHIVSGSDEIEISIPPGIENGAQIRMSGAGRGDLFIQVSVERHPQFERQNHFLVGRLYVSYPKLVLGGTEEIDFFGEKLSVKIPPRTSPGSRLRVKGRGMPMPQNPNIKSDMILDIYMKMPKALTKEHENMISSLLKMDAPD